MQSVREECLRGEPDVWFATGERERATGMPIAANGRLPYDVVLDPGVARLHNGKARLAHKLRLSAGQTPPQMPPARDRLYPLTLGPGSLLGRKT
jgi:hypothetical protein